MPRPVISKLPLTPPMGTNYWPLTLNRIDWDYEPAGDRDYMEKFLFIIADPYMEHPDYQPDWRQKNCA